MDDRTAVIGVAVVAAVASYEHAYELVRVFHEDVAAWPCKLGGQGNQPRGGAAEEAFAWATTTVRMPRCSGHDRWPNHD